MLTMDMVMKILKMILTIMMLTMVVMAMHGDKDDNAGGADDDIIHLHRRPLFYKASHRQCNNDYGDDGVDDNGDKDNNAGGADHDVVTHLLHRPLHK